MGKLIEYIKVFFTVFIPGVGSFMMEEALPFMLGLLAIGTVLYTLRVLFSKKTDKFQRILTAYTALVTSVIAGAAASG